MTRFSRICGVLGGILAIAASAWFLWIVVWREKFDTTKFNYGFWLSVFFMLMGAIALTALTLHRKKPSLARAAIWVSIAGTFLISNLDAPALWIIFWPGAILLIPAAVEISGNRAKVH